MSKTTAAILACLTSAAIASIAVAAVPTTAGVRGIDIPPRPENFVPPYAANAEIAARAPRSGGCGPIPPSGSRRSSSASSGSTTASASATAPIRP